MDPTLQLLQDKQKEEQQQTTDQLLAQMQAPQPATDYSPLIKARLQADPNEILGNPPPEVAARYFASQGKSSPQAVGGGGINKSNFLNGKENEMYFKNVQSGRPPMEGIVKPGNENQPISQVRVDQMGLIKKYFPQDQWENAYRVMMGESTGNPAAVGDNFPIDTGNGPETIPSVGLFQIRTLPGRPSSQQLADPEFNVRYAADMWKQQGWRPWSAATKLGIK